MKACLLYSLVVQNLFFYMVMAQGISYMQPTVQQYLHLTGMPHHVTVPTTLPSIDQSNVVWTKERISPGALTTSLSPELISRIIAGSTVTAVPGVPAPASNAAQIVRSNTVPTLSPAAGTSSSCVTNQNVQATRPSPPITGLPSLSALSLPNLISNLPQTTNQAPKINAANTGSSIDGALLNNLAIALQLLIVSNILNMPPPDCMNQNKKSTAETRAVPEMAQNQFQYPVQQEMVPPNMNYIGTSNYVEPSMVQPFVPGFAEQNSVQSYTPKRNNMALMSPYEALGSTSSYPDTSPSFGYNTRQDFKSPYALFD